MPAPVVWSSRRPLYRLNLVVLLSLTPFNLLGMLLPYWLETKTMVSSEVKGKVTMKDALLQYGIWRQCSDVAGCRWIYDEFINADVGEWMYPINVFMVLSSLCHLSAAILGASQNFLPREFSRHIRCKMLKKLLHRDSPFAEDVGFLAGFFGTMSCIIFMLSTKDQISGGAHYQWAFAFCFISSTLTVMASLTLTKTHHVTAPRPPSTRRSPASPESGRDGGARGGAGGGGRGGGQRAGGTSFPRFLRVLRPDDVRLEESQGATQAAGRSTARQAEAQSRSSSSRRRGRSRSRSRSRERSSHSRSRQQSSVSSVLGQSRLVRSPELEDIPAAVTPSSSRCPPGAGAQGRSRAGPVMCLQMTDLQSSATAPPASRSVSTAGGHAPSRSAAPSGSAEPREDREGLPTSPRDRQTDSHSPEQHRPQSGSAGVVSPSEDNAGVEGGDSPAS